MKLRNLYLVLLCVFLLDCSSSKLSTLFNNGKLNRENFITQIPFTYKLGLMIVQVEIEGEQYNFMVDTGAPCVISEELEKKLGLKPILRDKVGDSQGNMQQQNFYKLPEIIFGDLKFTEIGVVAADLKKSKIIACLEVDGFIGSNLLRKGNLPIRFPSKANHTYE